MPLRVAFHTLGCKLNQLETDAIAEAFARAGAEILSLEPEDDSPSPADLVLVNTCTVTSKAEQKARRIVRLALSANPDAVVLVTGCYAELEAEAISALGERVLVLPGSRKEALLALPSRLARDPEPGGLGSADPESGGFLAELRSWIGAPDRASAGSFAFDPAAFAFHSRPSLKVQDGCDNACAYCRVRIARGPARSLAAAEVLARARALEAAGRAEIVLTGVNLSQYRDGETDFPALLRLLLASTERIALRLSSYEPDRIDSAFLEAFAHPRVRPHAHLCVQSGADRVLAAMGRPYRRSDVVAAIEALRRSKGEGPDGLGRGPFIAADFIAGFPGESEADSASTLELARECGFSWIHAFRFSPRPGTAAATLPNRVPERLAGERVDALLEIGKEGRRSYARRWLGSEVEAIVETSGTESEMRATADNYLKLSLRAPARELRPGQAALCRIEEVLSPEAEGDPDALALHIGPSSRQNP
jgi:threonylcarbamoyladenosine tRNA methylthiotransferase MtaB